MIITQPSRPKIKRQRKESPHVVQTTTPSVTVTSVDTSVLYPSDQVLPAFYVSPTGSDSGEGTEADPFETLEAVRDAMRGSSTISRTYLRGGTYNVTSALLLNSNDAGTEWLAYPTETPVLDAGNGSFDIISASGCDNLTFYELSFQNTSFFNHFNNGNRRAIYLQNCDGCAIEKCSFDTVNTAISAQTCLNTLILKNTFTDIRFGAIQIRDGSEGSRIAGNHFSNISTDVAGLSTAGGKAGIVTRGIQDIIIEYNYMENCGYNGVQNAQSSTAITNMIVRYNVVIGSCQILTDGGSYYFYGGTLNTRYEGSLVTDNWAQPNAVTDTARCYYCDDGGGGLLFQNNVAVNGSGGMLQYHECDETIFENGIFLCGLASEGFTVWGNQPGSADNQIAAFHQRVNLEAYRTFMENNYFRKNLSVAIDSDYNIADYGSEEYIWDTIFQNNSGEQEAGWFILNCLNNIHYQNMAASVLVSESGSQDTNPLFTDFDPLNFTLTLNSNSPWILDEGASHITGVTDGGTFTWGSPAFNSNSGYDRGDY